MSNKSFFLKQRIALKVLLAGFLIAIFVPAMADHSREKVENLVSTGSGFFITSDGYFVTDYHVIENSKSIVLHTTDGATIPANLFRADIVNDLAILKAEGKFSVLPVTSSRTAKRGQAVATVGYPHADVQGMEPKVTEGIISSLSGIADDPRMFQISVPIQSGNSGGPLITKEGNVVGIIVSKLSATAMLKQTGDVTQNVNYAIKSNYLIELIETAGLKSKLPSIKRKSLNLEDVIVIAEHATALVVARPQHSEERSVAIATEPAGKVFRDCPDCPEMVVIPAGSFDMGSNNGYVYQSPVHRVTISHAFAMGKTEVTQGQWKAIMGNNPSKFQNCGDNCPVEQVSWNDAHEFIQKLNTKTGKQYRLPSEAEWEYSCRSGSQQKYCGSDDIDSVAWYEGNSGSTTHPVATKQSNAFGLYDMTGNAQEWVEDCWHDSYNGAPTDGTAWQGVGSTRVDRGSSYRDKPVYLFGVDRGGQPPSSRSYLGYGIGFRLARELPNGIINISEQSGQEQELWQQAEAEVSNSMGVKWVKFGANNTETVYTAPNTIRKSGNIVKMWNLIDYKTAINTVGMTYLSTKGQQEYDCKKESWRLLYFSMHSGYMGEGTLVYSNSDTGKWQPFPHDGSVGEGLWKIACGK